MIASFWGRRPLQWVDVFLCRRSSKQIDVFVCCVNVRELSVNSSVSCRCSVNSDCHRQPRKQLTETVQIGQKQKQLFIRSTLFQCFLSPALIRYVVKLSSGIMPPPISPHPQFIGHRLATYCVAGVTTALTLQPPSINFTLLFTPYPASYPFILYMLVRIKRKAGATKSE